MKPPANWLAIFAIVLPVFQAKIAKMMRGPALWVNPVRMGESAQIMDWSLAATASQDLKERLVKLTTSPVLGVIHAKMVAHAVTTEQSTDAPAHSAFLGKIVR